VKKLLLDSANVDEIKEFIGSGAISGVTTNPSLYSKETKPLSVGLPNDGRDRYYKHLEKVIEAISMRGLPSFSEKRATGMKSFEPKHLSVEVTTLDLNEMYQEAIKLWDSLAASHLSVDVHVKIPVMVKTLPVITKLVEYGVKVNATACMTASQAYLAKQAGAQIVSFFFNRMIDCAESSVTNMRELFELSSGQLSDARTTALLQIRRFTRLLRPANGYCDSEVICGSIRRPADVFDCWENGAGMVTASAKVIRQIVEHPATVASIDGFQKDVDSWRS
jgi:transaldolase